MTCPSRHSNPFATCWTKPGAASYAVENQSPAALVKRLSEIGRRGQIIGPHGAGKSTLVVAMETHARRAGWQWVRVNFHERQTRDAWRKLRRTRLTRQTLLVVDGFEQLGWLRRWHIRWRCQAADAGLLVTCHRSAGLPTLQQIAPSIDLALRIFRDLTSGRITPVTEADVSNAFNACGGNLRDVFFKLYDMHERRIRTLDVANTPHAPHVPRLDLATGSECGNQMSSAVAAAGDAAAGS